MIAETKEKRPYWEETLAMEIEILRIVYIEENKK